MIKRILHSIINRFESTYNYNADYLRDITNTSASASVRLMMLSGMTEYRGSDRSIWGGAALAGTLHGDCGPCAQLTIDRLLEAELDADQLRACVASDWQNAGSTGLGFRFAQAALTNNSNLSQLRTEIIDNHGNQALTAAAFATTSYTIYPLLKRALGHENLCTSLIVGDTENPILLTKK